DCSERADRFLSQPNGRIDQQLLGNLDDGPIGTADVLHGPALRAQARDNLNDQVDLVRQQWVEVDERFGGQRRQGDIGCEAGVVSQPTPVPLEKVAQRSLGLGVLREYASAGDLGDIRWLEMDLK